MKGMGLLTPDSLDPGCILDPVFLSMASAVADKGARGIMGLGWA